MGFWQPLFFWIFAIGALVTSCGVIAFRNPLYSALSLIVDFFCFAGLYVLLSAHFLAVTQILVYGGAIMVLFLFIIMLLNLREEELGERQFRIHHVVGIIAGVALFFFIGTALSHIVSRKAIHQGRQHYAKMVKANELEAKHTKGKLKPAPVALKTPSRVPGLYADLNETAVAQTYRQKLLSYASGTTRPSDYKYRRANPQAKTEVPPALSRKALTARPATQHSLFGTFEPISLTLVNRFVVPFELTAMLLLAAIIGAVIIAKKRLA